MRQRVKSYGESSTATLSPARMRMKFLRILPETCAKTWCLFSSSTRNIAFGSGSITVAMTSMASSLGLPESPFFLSSSCFAISSWIKTKSLPRRAGHLFGPRENQRTVGGDSDGVLEMGRWTAIGGFGYPLVAHADLGTAGIHHRFDGDDHAFLQARTAPGFPVIRQVRFVVHLGANAVPDEFAYYRKSILLDQALHRVANIAEAVAGAHLFNGAGERVAGHIQQFLQFRANLTDRNGDSRVREISIYFHAEVDGDDIAFLQLALRRRDPVNNLAVHRCAENARIPAIP